MYVAQYSWQIKIDTLILEYKCIDLQSNTLSYQNIKISNSGNSFKSKAWYLLERSDQVPSSNHF